MYLGFSREALADRIGKTMKALTEVFGLLESFQSFRVPTSEEARGHPYAPHPPSTPEQAQGENALTWGT